MTSPRSAVSTGIYKLPKNRHGGFFRKFPLYQVTGRNGGPADGRSETTEGFVTRARYANGTFRVLALVFCLCSGVSLCHADTLYAFSNDLTGGNWATAATWNCSSSPSGASGYNCVPANGGGTFADVTAFTYNPATITFNANPTTIDTLTVGGITTLQDDGNSRYLTIGDSTSPNASSGTLVNSATINWGNGGILTVGTTTAANANITNSGTLNISDATLRVNGNFGANSGTLNIGNATDASVSGTLTNTGTVTVTSTPTQLSGSQLTAAAVNTSGEVFVGAGSYLKVGTYTMSGGTTQVAGTLNSLAFTQTGGSVNVGTGATVTATDWNIFGGTATVQGQVLTETPPNGVILNGGTLNLQDGTIIGINGSLTNLGSIVTGNGVADAGLNSLSVTGVTTTSGSLSLNANGDSFTTGSLVNSGSLVVNSGTSLVDTGALTNSGSLTVTGCPLGGCTGQTTAQVTIDGTWLNSGAVLEQNAKNAGILPQTFITLQDLETVYNSGNIQDEAIDTLYFISETLPGVDANTGWGDLVDPPAGKSTPQANAADFMNLKGGSVELGASGQYLTITNGSFNNDAGASVTINGGNDRLIAAQSFVNAGTVNLSGAGDAIVTPAFVNTGNVSIDAGEAIAIKTLDIGGTIGTFNASSYSQSAGSTDVKGTLFSPVVSISGGTLLGTGLIANLPASLGGNPTPTALTVSSGTVMPGETGTPGTLTILGSYTQDAAATLLIDINGTGSGESSLLDVLGAASLDGGVTFDFGFMPLAGESFTFLTADAGELSGMFSSELFDGFGCPDCTLIYNDANGTVTLDVASTATPEPATFMLLGGGLLALGLIARGKKNR